MTTSTTEQYLLYLEERRRHLREEPWFYGYAAWRWIRGYGDKPYNWPY